MRSGFHHVTALAKVAMAGAALLGGVLLVEPRAATAGDKLAKMQLEKLLELGWSRLPMTVAEADQFYLTLVEQHAGDLQLERAHLLVSLKQRRFEQALQIVDRLAAHPQQAQEALRIKAWLLVFLKQYAKAGAAMEKLAATLPAADPADPAAAKPPPPEAGAGVAGAAAQAALEPEFIAKFLGRLQGYLDGPVAEQFAEPERNDLRDRLLKRLPERWQEPFTEARQQVLDKFANLQDDKAQMLGKAQEVAERKREDRLSELDQTLTDAEKRNERLNNDADKLRGEFKQQMSDLERRDAPLAQQAIRLGAQLDSSRLQVARDQAELAVEAARAAAFQNDEKRRGIPPDFVRMRFLEQRIRLGENDVLNVGAQLKAVAAQRAQLAAQFDQLRGTTGQKIAGMEREQANLQKQVKKANSETAKLKKQDISRPTGAVAAKSSVTQALATYETLPLDQLRDQFLESLK